VFCLSFPLTSFFWKRRSWQHTKFSTMADEPKAETKKFKGVYWGSSVAAPGESPSDGIMRAQMQSESREASDGRTDKIEMEVTPTEIIITQLYKLGKTPKQLIQVFEIGSVVYASPAWKLTGEQDEDLFILTCISADKKVSTRISHIFYLKGKAIDAQKVIGGNYKATGAQAPEVSMPDEFEVFDCLYLGSTQLEKAGHGDGYTDKTLTKIFKDGIDLREQIHTERKKLKIDRLHIENTMLDLDGDGSPEAVEEHPVVLVMTNRTFRITDSITGKPVLAFLTMDIEHVGQLNTGIDVSKEEGVKSTWNKTLAIVTNNKMSNFICVHHFFPLRQGNEGMMETIKDMASRAVGSYADLIEAGPFSASEGADVESTPKPLEHLSRDRAKLTAHNVIAAGEFGDVFAATEMVKAKGGKEVAAKRAVKTLKTADTTEKGYFTRECMLMVAIGKHKNICRMTGIAMQQSPWLRIIEYAAYGDMKALMANLLKKGQPLEPCEYLNMMVQCVSGGAYLAKRKVVHMDLNARNVLIGKKNNCKICDFDQAQPYAKGTNGVVLKKPTEQLAAKWAAPEIFTGLTFSEQSDVFAMGVTFWEMFSHGINPWDSDTDGSCSAKVLAGQRLPPAVMCPQNVWPHLMAMWNGDAAKRPTFSQLKDTLKAIAKELPTFNVTRDIGILSAGEDRTKDDVDYESDTEEYTGDALALSDAIAGATKPIPGIGWKKLRLAMMKARFMGGMAAKIAKKAEDSQFGAWGGVGGTGAAPEVQADLTLQECLAKGMSEKTFREVDTDGSGSLSQQEYQAWCAKKMKGGGVSSMLSQATAKPMDEPGKLEIKVTKTDGPFGFGAADAQTVGEKPSAEGYPTVAIVAKDSIAEAHGFQVGDLVIKVNGKNVKGYKATNVHAFVREAQPGHELTFSLKLMSKRKTGVIAKAKKNVDRDGEKAKKRARSTVAVDDGIDADDTSAFGKWATKQKDKHFKEHGQARQFAVC